MPKLNSETAHAFPVQVQSGPVEVARWRLHLSDLRPPFVHAHERLLCKIFGLTDAPGQQEHRSDQPEPLGPVEILELDRALTRL